ncbi:MAG: bifunctional tetrahydrofolate synthase/dihydrofolate synthase, partial [Hafniaceae bacterium]|nr:bifunctional tetrahydrofolate synthase/dihydrofolate synthase [Hafniaceae bacterium]
SPHLLRYTERVRIQGEELSEADHCRSFATLEAGRGDISLTYFEYGTLSALQLFKQSALDVVILEVGLGGRLDATNIVDPSVAVVTSIALDHTDWLGPDRESIGREKAGIFRAGIPAIVGEPDMPLTIAEVAAEKGAQLYRRGDDWNFSATPRDWQWQDADTTWSHLPLPKVPLPNAATALAALRHCDLKVDEAAIRQGLETAQLPGRFQIVSEQPLLILDVAHNPHAAGYLAGRLQQLLEQRPATQPRRVRAVVGMLEDKDIAGTLACLKPLIDDWYCAPLEGPRGAPAERLAEHLDEPNVFTDVESAWRTAMLDAAPQDIVIVCGSFHTVAHVMAVLEKHH